MQRNLTKVELGILRSAVRRQTGIVVLPRGLKGIRRKEAVRTLLARQLIRTIPKDVGMPLWRDEEGARLALQITGEGARLVLAKHEHITLSDPYEALDEGVRDPQAPRRLESKARQASFCAKGRLRRVRGSPARRRAKSDMCRYRSPRSPRPPNRTVRRGGFQKLPARRSLRLALLSRAQGASLETLMAATGWRAHSLRAWVSRLRRGGAEVRTSYVGRRAVYRLLSVCKRVSDPWPDLPLNSPQAVEGTDVVA